MDGGSCTDGNCIDLHNRCALGGFFDIAYLHCVLHGRYAFLRLKRVRS